MLDFFEEFWAAYPRKVKKLRTKKVFDRLKVDRLLLDQMLEALEWQRKEWAKADPQFTPHPSTWLNDGRWEDEKPEAPKSNITQFSLGGVNEEWNRRWAERYGGKKTLQ